MIEIRRLLAGDVPEALSISSVELGEDYLSDTDFLEAMASQEIFCNVAVEDGRVLGFAICRVFGPGEEPEVLGLPECPEREEVLRVPRSGILDSVAVSASAKGKGVGTLLCNRCAEDMRGMGCGLLCAMAWKSRTGRTNIAGILRGLGLSETVAIEGYWNRMVDSPEGHHCPECGAPCRCYGVFWFRTF